MAQIKINISYEVKRAFCDEDKIALPLISERVLFENRQHFSIAPSTLAFCVHNRSENLSRIPGNRPSELKTCVFVVTTKIKKNLVENLEKSKMPENTP